MQDNKIEIKVVEKEIFDAFQEKHKDDMSATYDGAGPINYCEVLWGVFEDGELKSIISVYAPDSESLLLTNAYTAPEARKKGYFSLLIKRFMAASEMLGFKLKATAFEKTSYPILKKMGFTESFGQKSIPIEFNPFPKKEADA